MCTMRFAFILNYGIGIWREEVENHGWLGNRSEEKMPGQSDLPRRCACNANKLVFGHGLLRQTALVRY